MWDGAREKVGVGSLTYEEHSNGVPLHFIKLYTYIQNVVYDYNKEFGTKVTCNMSLDGVADPYFTARLADEADETSRVVCYSTLMVAMPNEGVASGHSSFAESPSGVLSFTNMMLGEYLPKQSVGLS